MSVGAQVSGGPVPWLGVPPEWLCLQDLRSPPRAHNIHSATMQPLTLQPPPLLPALPQRRAGAAERHPPAPLLLLRVRWRAARVPGRAPLQPAGGLGFGRVARICEPVQVVEAKVCAAEPCWWGEDGLSVLKPISSQIQNQRHTATAGYTTPCAAECQSFHAPNRCRPTQAALAAQLPPASIAFGSPVAAAEPTEAGAALRLASGQRLECLAVVGADGARSAVAAAAGRQLPNYCGQTAVR